MAILHKFSLCRRILPILEIDHVENVRPRTFITVDTLSGAIALTTIDLRKALRLDLIDQALGCRLACDKNFGRCLRV